MAAAGLRPCNLSIGARNSTVSGYHFSGGDGSATSPVHGNHLSGSANQSQQLSASQQHSLGIDSSNNCYNNNNNNNTNINGNGNEQSRHQQKQQQQQVTTGAQSLRLDTAFASLASGAGNQVIVEERRLVLSQQKLNLICMVQFATSLMRALNGINKQSFQMFKLRVGVNTGPVIAGIIGAQRPFYDIWGDCVNVSSPGGTISSQWQLDRHKTNSNSSLICC